MKIAFIVTEFPKLSETFILNQITELLDSGHDVEIFSRFSPDMEKISADIKKHRLMERTHCSNMPYNRTKRVLRALYLIMANLHKDPMKILKSLNIFRYGKNALSLLILYTIIPFLGKKFDIIQCHFGPNGNVGACLKQIGVQGKLVVTFHGFDIQLGVEEGKNIYRQLFQSGNCFLAISHHMQDTLISFGAEPQKVIFHPNGIDLNKFPYRQNSPVVECSNSIVLLTVARLVEEKGLRYGILAISKVLKRNCKLHLEYRIVGGGPLEEELKRLIKDLNLCEVVHFTGAMMHEDVMREMQQAHIFLLPSIAEALPVVLTEAQAMGLPVVATSVGGVSQAMIDGKSGFLVPERDVDALVEKLGYLLEHPEVWSEMGKVGHKFVEKHYDVKKLNQKLAEIYESLL